MRHKADEVLLQVKAGRRRARGRRGEICKARRRWGAWRMRRCWGPRPGARRPGVVKQVSTQGQSAVKQGSTCGQAWCGACGF